MAEFPALPLFTDAYLGDTTHLSTFEHGAYLLLLIVSWRSPACRVADDDILLARYTRMTRDKWRKVRPILEPFFSISDGFWHQARLQDELQHLQSQKEARSKAGHAGNEAKALKRNNRSAANGIRSRTQDARNSDAPTPTPSIPLGKEPNGDSDTEFWDAAKAFLLPERKNPGSLIGKWIRDHGKQNVANAITRAQLDRAVERIPFIEGCFRKAQEYDPDRITV